MIPNEIVDLCKLVFKFIDDQIKDNLDIVLTVGSIREFAENTDEAYKVLLPLLVYAALGGRPEKAIPLAASWYLYNHASDIFDDIQDQDGSNHLPWNTWESSRAINAGLGILGICNTCLSKLDTTFDTLSDILGYWGNALLAAASGQNYLKNPTLDQYFNQVVSKSGMVFASVTLAGARLGSKDKNILSALFDYGMGIGIGIQIKDDCYDLSKNDLAAGMHTLPLIYALSLDVDPRRDELQTLLKAPLTEVNIESIKKLLNVMGAYSYSIAVMKVYEQKSLDALSVLEFEPFKSHLKTLCHKTLNLD